MNTLMVKDRKDRKEMDINNKPVIMNNTIINIKNRQKNKNSYQLVNKYMHNMNIRMRMRMESNTNTNTNMLIIRVISIMMMNNKLNIKD